MLYSLLVNVTLLPEIRCYSGEGRHRTRPRSPIPGTWSRLLYAALLSAQDHVFRIPLSPMKTKEIIKS